MNRTSRLLIALSFMSAALAWVGGTAADVWYRDGEQVEDSESVNSEGDFGVQQWLTHDPDQLFADWNEPTEGVPLATTNRAVRGQVVSSVIVFTGCKADAKGNCDVIADVTIFDPAGKEYGSFDGMEIWVDKPEAPKPQLQLGVNDVRIVIDPEDPLGDYRIVVETTDRNAGITLRTVQAFTAAESTLEYSTEPLHNPIFTGPQLPGEIRNYHDWLLNNASRMPPERLPAAREHLFSLIDSVVRRRYARDGELYSENDDPALRMLFFWAEKLGVYGGSLVLNGLLGSEKPFIQEAFPPESFSLALDGTEFTLTSNLGGWSASYPYNFMLWGLKDSATDDGPSVQRVTLSTGFARHEGQKGYSQATIMLVYAPSGDLAELERSVHDYFSIPPDSTPFEIELSGLFAHKYFDEGTNLHVEYVRVDPGEGMYVVVYSGIDGSYQWNRPHFVDFLRSLTASFQ